MPVPVPRIYETPATVRQIWEQHGAKQLRRQQSAAATQRHHAQRQTTMSRRAQVQQANKTAPQTMSRAEFVLQAHDPAAQGAEAAPQNQNVPQAYSVMVKISRHRAVADAAREGMHPVPMRRPPE